MNNINYTAVTSRKDLYTLILAENTGVEWCMYMGLLSSNRNCNHCGFEMRLKKKQNTRDKIRWVCTRKSCVKQEASVRLGSWFENSHLTIKQIMLITYEWGRNSKIYDVVVDAEVSEKTIIDWYSFIREVIVESMEEINVKIGGIGLTVELDETVIARRKYNRGRIAETQWLVGGVCRETKEMFFRRVENRCAETLYTVVCENVAEGTNLISDCWRGYNRLREEGFTLDQINHSENFVDPINPMIHTQNIENRWLWLKHFLHTKGTNRKSHLTEYIVEYQFLKRNLNVFMGTIDAIIRIYNFN